MFEKSKLHSAVLAAGAAVLAHQPVFAESRQIEEVTVTATKRAESAQDIPVTVQALGEESLKDLNVSNFDDYIRFMPNVTAGGVGPGNLLFTFAVWRPKPLPPSCLRPMEPHPMLRSIWMSRQ